MAALQRTTSAWRQIVARGQIAPRSPRASDGRRCTLADDSKEKIIRVEARMRRRSTIRRWMSADALALAQGGTREGHMECVACSESDVELEQFEEKEPKRFPRVGSWRECPYRHASPLSQSSSDPRARNPGDPGPRPRRVAAPAAGGQLAGRAAKGTSGRPRARKTAWRAGSTLRYYSTKHKSRDTPTQKARPATRPTARPAAARSRPSGPRTATPRRRRPPRRLSRIRRRALRLSRRQLVALGQHEHVRRAARLNGFGARHRFQRSQVRLRQRGI